MLRGRWLITGAGGQLGSVLLRTLVRRGQDAHGLISPSGPAPETGPIFRADLADPAGVGRTVTALAPSVIVHAAAVTSLAAARDDQARAHLINVKATAALAEAARSLDARLVFLSTDLVFDGTAAPYDETARSSPLSVYGRTKVEAEKVVGACRRGVVVRAPLMYGLPASLRQTTFTSQIAALRTSRPLRLFFDEFRSPMWLEDAALAVIAIAESDAAGAIHIAGPQRLSRFEMGGLLCDALNVPRSLLIPCSRCEADAAEPRPEDVTLDCGLFVRRFGRAPGRPVAECLREIVASLN